MSICQRLQSVAANGCSVLQVVKGHYHVPISDSKNEREKDCVSRCSMLQCVAVRCSALQCVAVSCSVMQSVAVCFSVLHQQQ